MVSRVMFDYDSGDLAGSSHCFVTNPRPPSSSSAYRSVGLLPRWPFFPRLSSGQVESALTTPPILLLGVAELTLPPPRLLQQFLLRSSSHTPGFDVFFYSGHPTIFPASLILSMDSLQRFVSSLTQLLEFASNSATSALPLLRSADVQPAPRPFLLTFILATLVLARL
ncbi:hypothetical protein CRENBAI_002901 [Crenichthys baileyi]|uniref:Uncharacterized protein n=1 Tax=Crenichthys baileyi TaxID=28760 RepID=A0AAV9SM82_9TELE